MNYYIIDAFAEKTFQGNPAGVCVTQTPLEPAVMKKIAAENNLPETAFLHKTKAGYALRWFTPLEEIDLCGHGTLAAAYVVSHFLEPAAARIRFFTQSGVLEAVPTSKGYELFLPRRAFEKIDLPLAQQTALGAGPVEILSSRDLILVLENEAAVRRYTPDYSVLNAFSRWLGVAVTAQGEKTDFVTRYFCPELMAEDPVTGSVHCVLAPYWAEKLGKSVLTARQLSARGGALRCTVQKNRVALLGSAALYLKGEIDL
ncbi:MAG: PhzF family phenazine biosynthesis protein [Oscillospiraceae bacterium]|nr:PhzF family phenazine biosynthesis protein [Oscillospiraceae bacterium]